MNEELDSFVGTEETEVETTVETTAESQAVEESAAEPDVSSQGAEEGEPPAPAEKPQETMIPLAAKQKEKERRKQAEKERDDLRLEMARLQGMQQAQVKTELKEIPDAYTNPEEYTQYVINQQNEKLTAQQQKELYARLESAEAIAKVELPDYDEYADYFAKVVAPTNQKMIDQMKVAPDPAKFAYYMGKQHKQDAEASNKINQAGGLAAYEAALREQIKAELESQKPVTNIPPDLTSVRNAGGEPVGDDIADGTDGLNQLLGR